MGFEPTPPKRLVPKTSALDHSATLPMLSIVFQNQEIKVREPPMAITYCNVFFCHAFEIDQRGISDFFFSLMWFLKTAYL